MHTLCYDGSFDGLLSAVFHIYAAKIPPQQAHLTTNAAQTDLFGSQTVIATDAAHAGRVFARLEQTVGRRGMHKLLHGFLSNHADMPDTFLRIVSLIVSAPPRRNPLADYGHPDIMQWAYWIKAVSREKHHMEAFVRFEEYENGLFLAQIEPRYDVIPLILPHFCRRYPQQYWAIYDNGRGYGAVWHQQTLSRISELDTQSDSLNPAAAEAQYQKLWRRYFQSTTIRSRINPKLHRQQMPARYWRYLTEKQPEPHE